MGKKKALAAAIAAVGVTILLVFALADIVGIGGNPLVFGYWQLVGVVAGGALAVIGAVLHWWFGRGE